MPQKKSAYKELRKSKKRHLSNMASISDARTIIKKFNLLIADKKFDDAKKILGEVTSKLHKAASKGVIRKNAASRKIAQLSKNLHKLQTAK